MKLNFNKQQKARTRRQGALNRLKDQLKSGRKKECNQPELKELTTEDIKRIEREISILERRI